MTAALSLLNFNKVWNVFLILPEQMDAVRPHTVSYRNRDFCLCISRPACPLFNDAVIWNLRFSGILRCVNW